MWRSYNKNAFVKALRRLIPEIKAEHLVIEKHLPKFGLKRFHLRF